MPDLLGCAAVAEIKSDACQLIREAIELYIETLENDEKETFTTRASDATEANRRRAKR